jgi:hypothetical protein
LQTYVPGRKLTKKTGQQLNRNYFPGLSGFRPPVRLLTRKDQKPTFTKKIFKMGNQNFKSHARYVPGFHFITLGLIVVCFVLAAINLVRVVGEASWLYTGLMPLLGAVVLGLLFLYVRQFATGNQDRIIRAEENFRSFRLTGKPLDYRLTKRQIIALRFADDNEYAALSAKAISDNLGSQDIKKTIQQWRADHHRV